MEPKNRSQIGGVGNCVRTMIKATVHPNNNANASKSGMLSVPSYCNITSKKAKKLTSKEMDERRQKGLCFRRDENSVLVINVGKGSYIC